MGKRNIKHKKQNITTEDSGKINEDENVFDEVVPKWYDQIENEKTYEYEHPTEEELLSLRSEAEQVLEQETKHYHTKAKKGNSNNDTAWLNTMLTKGTSKDKVAAHIISIQNAPQYNITQLQGLVNMVKASKQRDGTSVMDNLADLFLEDLLIPSRKLRTFDKQPLTKLFEITSGCVRARKVKLTLWLFEEKLKECYNTYIQAVDNIAKDTVDSNRIKAVATMNKLLSGHPEQEHFLLKNLVNKIGDPNPKVVCKVTYSMTQLLRVHPNMKQVVMNEVEKFLFRPNLSASAQYYSISFLTQFIFQGKDRDIARNIINIYFSFFKAAIKKGEVDSKLMGALLVGVKRAHPYAKLSDDVMREHTDTLYKLVHLTPFNVAVHALCLLQEVSSQSDDRFYNALYKKLLDPDISKSCHQAIFINLLYKAITKDTNIPRLKAIIKRLLQVSLSVPSPLACGFLYLISQILSKNRSLLAFQSEILDMTTAIKIENMDDDDDDGEEKYDDVDEETPEVDVKNEEIIELESYKNNLIQNVETIKCEDEMEIKEEFTNNSTEGWVYKNLSKPLKKHSTICGYNPLARNPAYANADKSAYFEVISLINHFHPSVALFARNILTSERITYSGDPLADFTLIRFLDRFCFKNPKKLGDGIKGPDPTLAQRKYYQPSGVKSIPVLSKNYLSQERTNIPVDEVFLYKYLRDKHGDGTNFEKKDDDDDNSSVNSEEFEEMLDGLMGKTEAGKLDFMEDIGETLKKKKGAKEADEDDASSGDDTIDEDVEEEESDEEEEGDNKSDGDANSDDLEEMDDDAADIDETDANAIDFSDDDGADNDIDLDEEFFDKSFSSANKPLKFKNKKQEKLKKLKGVKGLKTKGGLDSLFAPAEEFAEILDEAGTDKRKHGTIHAMSNVDGAAPKQLDWETKRNRYVKNLDNRKRKFKQGNKNKSKSFKKKKTH